MSLLRTSLCLLLFVLVLSAAGLRTQRVLEREPRLQVVLPPAAVSLEEVEQSGIPVRFRNIGGARVILHQLHSGCRCKAQVSQTHVLRAGQELSLMLSLPSGENNDLASEQIRFSSNDRSLAEFAIQLKPLDESGQPRFLHVSLQQAAEHDHPLFVLGN
jgi:hypothetical protein